ncbi:hypothetical protein Aduo_012045 [Ancylostoma duodenale]
MFASARDRFVYGCSVSLVFVLTLLRKRASSDFPAIAIFSLIGRKQRNFLLCTVPTPMGGDYPIIFSRTKNHCASIGALSSCQQRPKNAGVWVFGCDTVVVLNSKIMSFVPVAHAPLVAPTGNTPT